MKATERHRLKTNDLAQTITTTRDYVELHQKTIGIVIVLALLVAAAGVGVTIVRGRTSAAAQGLLAEAMVVLGARVLPVGAAAEPGEVPAAAQLGAEGSFATEAAKLGAALPKLQAAADAYPDTDSGITARYHMAGALATLGRSEEAIAAFDEVTRRAGTGNIYGRMARLGKADTEAKAGKLDAAVATWKDLAASDDADLPQDALLLELAKAYVAQGNQDEARKTFTQLVEEYPTSLYAAEARTELDRLKS